MKYTTQLSLCLLLCLTLSLPLSAHISGQVVDEAGEPLPFANIYWAGTTIGTSSDSAGTFEIEPVRQTRLLVCSYTGYISDTTEILSAHKPITFVLISTLQLDEVSVTSRKMAVLRDRMTALDVQTLTSESLCKAACCNLSESFETSAAVDVAYADAATGAKQIRMLGLNGTYVQLLTENTPSIRGLAQTFGMEYIPGAWMHAIQVSKGTSSVLNGHEAIAGQINVEYLKPQQQDPLDVNLMLNNECHAEIDVTGGWKINPHVSTGVLLHMQDASLPIDDNHDGFLDLPLNHQLNLLNRWYFTHGDYNAQLLLHGLYDQRIGGQVASINHPYCIDLRTRRVDGFLKNGYLFDEDLGTSIGVITAASYHSLSNTYGQRIWDASQTNAYLNAVFQTNFENPRLDPEDKHEHKLSAGLSLNYDRYRQNYEQIFATLPQQEGITQEWTPGLFAEYTYSYEDIVTLLLGLREDYSSRYGWFTTPRMNIRYAPFAWWTLRGSVGLGYRSPNIIADNTAYLPSNRWYSCDAISQEKSLNTGLTTTFYIPLGSREMTLTAEYYYTRFLDGMIVDIDANPHQVQLYSIGSTPGAQSFAHNYQIEANVEILKGWTLTAAFRYTDVRQTTWHDGQLQLREKVLQNRFKGVISTSYQTPKKSWQFDVTAQFNGPGRMPDGFVVPEGSQQYTTRDGQVYHKWYPQLMAQVTKYFRHCSLYVGADNMSNYRQQQPIAGEQVDGYINPHSADFDASMVWAPINGWGLYAGLRVGISAPKSDDEHAH